MREPVILILTAAHKKVRAPENRYIRLIQVGSALAPERLPGMLHDDEGINISCRNRSFCELTAQYYVWKNLEADYYGFFHYCRYMSFAKEYPPWEEGERNIWRQKIRTEQPCPHEIRKKNRKIPARRPAPYIEADSPDLDLAAYAADEKHIRRMIEKYDVVTVLGEHMNVTVYEQFCQFHDRQELDRMIRILKKRRPEYAAACDVYMQSKYIYFCNMYLMQREYFMEYMEWLFPLLEEYEAGKDFAGCSGKQMRITGYLAERLFGVYYTWLGQQKKARRCELQYVIFGKGSAIRRFRLWKNGPELVLDMKKINRLFPAGTLRRRLVRTLAGRVLS